MSEVKPDNPMAKALAEAQKPRITNEDCEILSVFKNDSEIMLALRNLFFGFDLNKWEKEQIGNRLQSDGVKKVIKKSFLPELESHIPVGQNIDLWATKDIVESTEETFKLDYKVKELLIGMIKTSLAKLDDIDNKGVDLTPKKDMAFLKARIGYINHVTMVLNDMLMNAHRSSGQVAINPKDSSK